MPPERVGILQAVPKYPLLLLGQQFATTFRKPCRSHCRGVGRARLATLLSDGRKIVGKQGTRVQTNVELVLDLTQRVQGQQ